MKTVIAPVDFSDASTNALLFAGDLARRASANLIVVNILQEDGDEAEARKKLNEVTEELKGSFADLKYESFVAHGNLVLTLKEIVASQQPDLVVMGTKGASGLKRILIGSNTVNVIANTTVPVLVIPEAARFEDFLDVQKNRIVLATDLDALENDNAPDILKEIALLIKDPKIRVVSVRSKGTELDYMKRLERDALLSRFNPEVPAERITVFSGSVLGGINFYLNEHRDTGLVAMIARDTGDLIQRHYTREMASHTQLPLLIMHDAKN